MDVEFWVSVAVLAYALVIGGWLGVITARSTRGTTFMEAMIQTSFLPEKRRRYLSIISIEGGAILLAGIVWGLSEAGFLPDTVGSLVTGALLVSAMTSVAGLTLLGLRPSRLTMEDQEKIRRDAPQVFYSLFMAPISTEADPSPTE